MWHLVRKNLTRKKLRSLFTILSIAIAFILFALLGALSHSFSLGLQVAGADRLITMHRVSFIQPLPLAYVNRIEGIEGVRAVAHYTWFGGYYQDPKRQFGLLPTEFEDFRAVYPEYSVPDEQWQRLRETRIGLLAGKALADTYGWKVGDRVPLGSTIYPQKDGNYTWEFEIAAIFTGVADGGDEMQAFAHYDYFNEGRSFGTDQTGWIVTRVDDPDRAEAVAAAIDERFANSSTETKTTSEKGWVAGFAAQFGNIGLIVQAILAAVFFTLLLVAGNTMAQAVRERTSELAVLKTLGFSDQRVMAMVLAESLLISAVGGGLGLLLGLLFVGGARAAISQFLPGLAVPGATLMVGIGLIVGLGLVTGIAPALQAMRLNVVTALARR